jgi:hypothetical protein
MGRFRPFIGLAIAAALGAGIAGTAQAYDESNPTVQQDDAALSDPEIYTGYFGMNDQELAALADDRTSYGLTDDECMSIVFIARAAGVPVATAVRDYCGPCHRSLDLLMSRYGVPREAMYVDLPADSYVPPIYQPLYGAYWYGWYGGCGAFPYCNADCAALIDFRVGCCFWHCHTNAFFSCVAWTGSPCWALHQCCPWGAHPATWNGSSHAHGTWIGTSTWSGAHGSWSQVAASQSSSATAHMPQVSSEHGATAVSHLAIPELRRPAPAPSGSSAAAAQVAHTSSVPGTHAAAPQHGTTSSWPHLATAPALGTVTHPSAPAHAGMAGTASDYHASVMSSAHSPSIVQSPGIVHAPAGAATTHAPMTSHPPMASAPHSAPAPSGRPASAVALPQTAGGYAVRAPSVANAPHVAVSQAPHGYAGGGGRTSGAAVSVSGSYGGGGYGGGGRGR